MLFRSDRISRQFRLACSDVAHAWCEFRRHNHDPAFCQGCSMIESGLFVEVVALAGRISAISAVLRHRFYGVCRSFWKYVVLSSPGNPQFAYRSSAIRRGNRRVCPRVCNRHIVVSTPIHGSAFRSSCGSSRFDRNPCRATAPPISLILR